MEIILSPLILFLLIITEENNINVKKVEPNKGQNNDLFNNRIPFKEILVIDQNGEQLGVMSRNNALALAEQAGLDLLCVAPNAKPPVCKIINYGKYRFDKQKNERLKKQNQKGKDLKELRFTPTTGYHDLEILANHGKKLLAKGHKLKVSIFVRGRLGTKQELIEEQMNKFIDLIKEDGFVEKAPQSEGKYYFCYISAYSKK